MEPETRLSVLPLSLIPASGSGLHAASGRRSGHPQWAQAKRRRVGDRPTTSPALSLSSGHIPQLLATPHGISAGSCARPSSAAGGKAISAAPSFLGLSRPRSACALSGAQHTYSGQVLLHNVSQYEQMCLAVQAGEVAHRKQRWAAERDALEAAQLRAAERERAARLRQARARQDLQQAKRDLAQAHLDLAHVEAKARRSLESEYSRLRKRLTVQRWSGGVALETEFGIRVTRHCEGSERLVIACDEVYNFEAMLRKCLMKHALFEMAQHGETEREKVVHIQLQMDRHRRFVVEQEQQVHRFINSEAKERESTHAQEMSEWMQIERQQRDWAEEQRLEALRRQMRAQELHEAHQKEYQKERHEVETEESQKRQRSRIDESDERMELARMEHTANRDAQEREAKRLEEEAAILRALHEEQQRPIIEGEHTLRCEMEAVRSAEVDAIVAEYAAGKATIMKPVVLACPDTARYVMGTAEVPFLAGSTFHMKQDFNPYKNKLIVQLQLDVSIGEGYTPGDNLGVSATSRRSINEGCKLVRFGRGLHAIHRVARVQGRTDEQGCFRTETRQNANKLTAEIEPHKVDHSHRWLRAHLVIHRTVDPVRELDWLLQKVTFIPRSEDWTPDTDATPREVTVSVTLGIGPCHLDDPDVKLYTCTVSRTVKIDPLPPFFYLPLPSRHVPYDITREKLQDGKRPAKQVLGDLMVLHPEREACGSILSVVLNPSGVEGDRLQLQGAAEIKYLHTKRPRTVVHHNGVEIAEVLLGTFQPQDDPLYELTFKLSNIAPLWKIGDLLKSIRFSNQAKYPYRPRRCIDVVYTDSAFPNHPLAFSCWINMVVTEEIGPNLMTLTRTSSQCVIYRTSGQSAESSKYIEPAITAVAPDGFVQNQHAIGVPEYGATMFNVATFNFKVDQGVQTGDSLCIKPCSKYMTTDIGDKIIYWKGKRFGKWQGEIGGAHAQGTYEGATSPAWLKVDLILNGMTEDQVTTMLRSVCFSNRGPKPAPGLRWISATFMSVDPAMPAAPPAKARIGVRVCLPIMTLPPRFLTQKYIENEGNKRFGQFEIPDPIFKDDDMVAVFDGGSIKVEILEGLTSDDQLGLLEDPKHFEAQESKKHMCFIKMAGMPKPSAMYVPPEPGMPAFSISLGRSSDRRKTLDTSLKKPHSNKIKKKELLILLKNLYYRNSSEDPDCFRKILRVTVTDSFGAVSQAVIDMPIQAINNKTVVTLPTTDLVYRKGSYEEQIGLQLCGAAVLTDPDTLEIREGFISVESTSGSAKLDALEIMSQTTQAIHYAAEGVSQRDHIYVTLGPLADGFQDVKIGGHKVGTLEHRPVNTGVMLRFNISLEARWPGWAALPCKLARQNQSLGLGGGSMRKSSARVPSLSPFVSKGNLTRPDRPFGPKDCTGNLLSFEPAALVVGRGKSRSPSISPVSIGVPLSPRRKSGAEDLASGMLGSPGGNNSPRSPRRSSVSPGPATLSPRRASAALPGVFGLPMDAAQLLLRVVLFRNNNDPSSLRPGMRAFAVKVNAGDDVADTKIKIQVNVQPQLVSLAPAYSQFTYVEGSDFVPLSLRYKIGIDQKYTVRRGYIRATLLNAVGEEDEVSFYDPYHLHYIVWDDKPVDHVTAVQAQQGHTPRVAGRRYRKSMSGGVLYTDLKEVKDPKAQAVPTVVAKVRQGDECVELHFDETCPVGHKTLGQLVKFMCYRNTSAVPNTDVLREVKLSLLLSMEGGKYNPDNPPPESQQEFDSCTLHTKITIEAVDNPTEVHIPHPCLHYCSPASGFEPEPLQLVPGVVATDPDTPVFNIPSEIIVQIAGGSRSDLVEMSHLPPEGDDAIMIQENVLHFEGIPVALLKRDHNNHPAALRLELDGCPIEALSVILRRMCYRHMSPIKRQLKKIVNITVKAALPPIPDQKVQPKPTITRVSMTVVVMPAPFDYSPGVTQKLVQIGRQPLVFLPTSAKVCATNFVELRFELVRPPSGVVSLPMQSSVIPREFWAPFESLSWEKNLRAPTEHDAMKFLPLSHDFTVKEIGEDRYDVSMKEGKVCTIALLRKDFIGKDQQVFRCCHEASIAFGTLAKLPIRERDVVKVLRSLAYVQVPEKRLTTVQNALPAQEHSPMLLMRLTQVIPVPKPQQTVKVVDHFCVRPRLDDAGDADTEEPPPSSSAPLSPKPKAEARGRSRSMRRPDPAA